MTLHSYQRAGHVHDLSYACITFAYIHIIYRYPCLSHRIHDLQWWRYCNEGFQYLVHYDLPMMALLQRTIPIPRALRPPMMALLQRTIPIPRALRPPNDGATATNDTNTSCITTSNDGATATNDTNTSCITRRQSHIHDSRPAHWKLSNVGQCVVVRWMRLSFVTRSSSALDKRYAFAVIRSVRRDCCACTQMCAELQLDAWN